MQYHLLILCNIKIIKCDRVNPSNHSLFYHNIAYKHCENMANTRVSSLLHTGIEHNKHRICSMKSFLCWLHAGLEHITHIASSIKAVCCTAPFLSLPLSSISKQTSLKNIRRHKLRSKHQSNFSINGTIHVLEQTNKT